VGATGKFLGTCILILVIVGCTPASPTVTLSSTSTPTPTSTLTPTLRPTVTPTPTCGPVAYVVEAGDTLSRIASERGMTADVLCAFNALPDCNLIMPGQELLIPCEVAIGPSPTQPGPSPTPTLTLRPSDTPTSTPTLTPPDTATPIPSAEIAQVVSIVDGDTIDVQIGGQVFRVRYIGMNTPEIGQLCAAEATNYNTELVMGKTVTLVKDVSETDQYGRLLRYVYLGDIFVNAELVRQGYANAATYPPDVAYADLFVQLEAEARAAGRGCWAVPTPTPGAAWNCVGNIYNCSDFSSCAEVMSYWHACPGDPSRLDGDHDGKPCETLCGY